MSAPDHDAAGQASSEGDHRAAAGRPGAGADGAAADQAAAERAAGEGGGEGAAGGEAIVRFSVGATVAFAVTSALAVALPDTFSVVSVPVALALFVVGSGAFLWGFAVAVGRSQHEAVGLGGLFFLGEGTADRRVRRLLRGLLGVQVVVAVAAAAARPFSELAFGILAPTLGLGMMTLWAARHGRFAPKRPGAR